MDERGADVTLPERWTIESPRFGTFEVESGDLIQFDGLPGFAELRRFVVLQHDRESPFGWLQSVDRPELAFPVTDPRSFFPNYRPALRAALLSDLAAEPTDELDWLAIATLAEGSVSLNLAAPLLINRARRRGVQAILEDDGWSTREPLPKPKASSAARTDPNG